MSNNPQTNTDFTVIVDSEEPIVSFDDDMYYKYLAADIFDIIGEDDEDWRLDLFKKYILNDKANLPSELIAAVEENHFDDVKPIITKVGLKKIVLDKLENGVINDSGALDSDTCQLYFDSAMESLGEYLNEGFANIAERKMFIYSTNTGWRWLSGSKVVDVNSGEDFYNAITTDGRLRR